MSHSFKNATNVFRSRIHCNILKATLRQKNSNHFIYLLWYLMRIPTKHCSDESMYKQFTMTLKMEESFDLFVDSSHQICCTEIMHKMFFLLAVMMQAKEDPCKDSLMAASKALVNEFHKIWVALSVCSSGTLFGTLIHKAEGTLSTNGPESQIATPWQDTHVQFDHLVGLLHSTTIQQVFTDTRGTHFFYKSLELHPSFFLETFYVIALIKRSIFTYGL